MFQCNQSVYEKGMVLRTEMLQRISDYPREMLEGSYLDYSDGILSGTVLTVEDSNIVIGQGLIKHHGYLYHNEEIIKLKYPKDGKQHFLKLRFNEVCKNREQYIRNTDVYLSDEFITQYDEVELGRFNVKDGALLRTKYVDFADYHTEFNTLNQLNVPYASKGGSTLSPNITKAFASEMMKKYGIDQRDMYLVMECLRGEAVNRELLVSYLSTRFEKKLGEADNEQIYQYLLRLIQEGSRQETTKKRTLGRRMLVD